MDEHATPLVEFGLDEMDGGQEVAEDVNILCVIEEDLVSDEGLFLPFPSGQMEVGGYRNRRTSLILSLPLMADNMLNIPRALRLSTSRALGRSPIQRPGDTSSMDMESKERR